MDARTGVQRQPPSRPVWIAAGERRAPSGGPAPVADQDSGGLQASACDARRSEDPLRATDRYRLVMPYAEDV